MGLLSVQQQAYFLDQFTKIFSVSEYRERENIINSLAPNGEYISSLGEDGIESFIFILHAMKEEVERLAHQYPKIRYLSAIGVGFRDGEFLSWDTRAFLI